MPLSVPRTRRRPTKNNYPTTDPKAVPGTEFHHKLLDLIIGTLRWWFRDDDNVCVSGDLLVFYQRNNRRAHVAPDVFVVRGVPRVERDNYLIWEEGKPPHCVIELTSPSTYKVDLGRKLVLYRDVLRVKEYFLFDADGDCLVPSLQGYRLRAGRYVPIRPVAGRLPSQVLGLHLERDGRYLRFYDPATKQWVLTPEERFNESLSQTERERAAREAAEAEAARERAARVALEARLEALQRAHGQTPPQP